MDGQGRPGRPSAQRTIPNLTSWSCPARAGLGHSLDVTVYRTAALRSAPVGTEARTTRYPANQVQACIEYLTYLNARVRKKTPGRHAVEELANFLARVLWEPCRKLDGLSSDS